MTLSSWFVGIGGRAPSPKWAAVLDTSVLVAAAVAASNDRPNPMVVRAAIAGVFECVLSEYIQEELREVLADPDFGFTSGEIEAKFGPLWAKATFLTPVPHDDPKLLEVVHGDLLDVPVLATGLAIFVDPLLATLPRKFCVSNNTKDFTPGWKPFGLEFVSGPQFWALLRQGAKAKPSEP